MTVTIFEPEGGTTKAETHSISRRGFLKGVAATASGGEGRPRGLASVPMRQASESLNPEPGEEPPEPGALDAGDLGQEPGRKVAGVEMVPPAEFPMVALDIGLALGTPKGSGTRVDGNRHLLPMRIQFHVGYGPQAVGPKLLQIVPVQIGGE